MDTEPLLELPRDTGELVRLVKNAGAIWAVDRTRRARTLVFGRTSLDSIDTRSARTIAFDVNLSAPSDDLRYLREVVSAVKSSHESA